MTPNRRQTSTLSTSLQKRLNTYAIAAAGVSLMALTSPSEAEIVYTPANKTITRDRSYNLDLNHDGIVDFVLVDHRTIVSSNASHSFQILAVSGESNNGVDCIESFCLSTNPFAAALQRGSEIGPAQHSHGWLPQSARMATIGCGPLCVSYSGSWNNFGKRYLGLRFQINGETHVGWARLNVVFHNGNPQDRTFIAQLSGYAYETIAGKPIRAGQTTEALSEEEESDASVSSDTPARLGAFALGNSGFPLWRREH